jgi:hypothetical protein
MGQGNQRRVIPGGCAVHKEGITPVKLNTPHPASRYEAFEPAEARSLLERCDFHYTPKHGSWLKMAEIEFSALQRHCLDRRIPDQETLRDEIAAWEERRNRKR